MPLRLYIMCLRDLNIIPHLTTEYKAKQVFMYFEMLKESPKHTGEIVITLGTFIKSLFILFAITMEEE